MSGREVWVTGLGALTAAGPSAFALEGALRQGRSGVRPTPTLRGLAAGRVGHVPCASFTRRLDRSARLFVAAAAEAWQDAGLALRAEEPERFALAEGSSLGPMADLLRRAEEREDRRRSGEAERSRPSDVLRFMTGAGGAAFAQLHHLAGPVLHVSAGSVSGAAAIGEGFRWITEERADVVVTGGAECPLHPAVVDRFVAAGIVGESSPAVCRPFAPDRHGTVLGEGGGALVLEARDHALSRGAPPRAIIAGYGLAGEHFSMIAPDPEGDAIVGAGRAALSPALAEDVLGGAKRGRSAEPRPASRPPRPPGEAAVDWIKAHGTGTPSNDAAEVRALQRLFGVTLPDVPVTGFKPLLGHCLGASGAVEAVGAVLALEGGYVPGIGIAADRDPALPPCDIVWRTRRVDARVVLLLTQSFGGRCAALALRKAA